MGLFDRKRESEPEPERKPPVRAAAQPKPAPKSAAKPEPQPAVSSETVGSSEFGIQKAMELMRSLPSDNLEIVVRVVKATLESANVDVPSIIADAAEKRRKIETRISGLKEEIGEFEEEITGRRQEIKALEADNSETKAVQDKLELSIKLDKQESPKGSLGDGVPRPSFDKK
jgi:hypothetical protein